jgi:hypothetical protein
LLSPDIIARSVAHAGAGARESRNRTLGKPLQVAVAQRRIGGDDEHDRSIGALVIAQLVFEVVLPECFTHPHTVYREHAAEIALDQHTDRVPTEFARQFTAAGANSSFEAERHSARAGADGAFFHRAGPRGFDRFNKVLFRQRPRTDVIQVTVVRLAHHGVHRVHLFIARLGKSPFHQCRHSFGNIQRVGKRNRCFNLTQFPHLAQPGEFSIAVRHENCRRELVLPQISIGRDDHRNARIDPGAIANRHLADFYSAHIRDRVQRSRCEYARCYSDIASPGSFIGCCRSRQQHH